MKVEISEDGVLIVAAETRTETFALKEWHRRSVETIPLIITSETDFPKFEDTVIRGSALLVLDAR